MKIAIIGKGTSSIVTALNCILRGHEVTFYYDENIPHISVGESSTPHLLKNLTDVCGITVDELVEQKIASIKKGVHFIGWGKTKYFIHPFANETIAIHFQTNIFNEYVHNILKKKFNISYIPLKVEDSDYKFSGKNILIHGNEYDFVIECSGWYYENGYTEIPFKTVDSAILYTSKHIENKDYTIHRATKHGWQFELPFPKDNLSKCGYLFNSNLIDNNQINFLKNNFNSDKIINWKPRHSKKIFRDPRIAMNGNKLFFFEPLQALSLLYYHIISEIICDFLDNRSKLNYWDINFKYLQHMSNYQKILAFHYRFGSLYDSKYWNHITNKAFDYSMGDLNIGNIDILISNLNKDIFFMKNFDIVNSYSDIGIMSGNHDVLHLLMGFLGKKENEIVSCSENFTEFIS